MEHPPKQGLKRHKTNIKKQKKSRVLMEHPPKQGLKQIPIGKQIMEVCGVLMEHPPKQGLKQNKRVLRSIVYFEF